MKLKYIYFLFLVVLTWVSMKSDKSGRGSNSTQSCNSGGCHIASLLPTTVDSLSLVDIATGSTVTQYVPGRKYTVAIVGNNFGMLAIGTTYPNFGFQVWNPTGKGTFSGPSSGSVVTSGNYWGHNTWKTSIAPIPNLFIDTCSWTAPIAGSGNVLLSARMVAVNANNGSNGDAPTTTTYTKTLTEASPISITKTPLGNPCPGDNVTFTATNSLGGSPTFQWYRNNITVGTGGNTWNSSALNTNDSVWCVMTIGASNYTSNKIKITIGTTYINNVTIVSDKSSLCAGDTATFTATPNPGANTTNYRWFVNGVQKQGQPVNFTNTPTFKNSGWTAGDSVWCSLNVNNNCATPIRDTSNYLKLTINPSPVISGNNSLILCHLDSSDATAWTSSMSGTTFSWTNNNTSTGIPANGSGQMPKYKLVNSGGAPVVSTITISSFASGCAGVQKTFTITVRPSPRIFIPNDSTYCEGDAGSFILTTQPPNAKVLWTNNNTQTGIVALDSVKNYNFTAANPTVSNTILSTISAKAISGTCASKDTTFKISVNKTPVANPITNIVVCNNEVINIPAFTSNLAGVNYNWTNSDVTIGLGASGSGNISSFTAINNGTTPVVSTISVTPSTACNGIPITFTITVNAPSPAFVDLFSADTLKCPNTDAIFKATPTNGGTTPTYSWIVNGANLVHNFDTLTINNFQNNDEVFAIVTSSASCVTTTIDTSNKVTLKHVALVKPTIGISCLSDTFCTGNLLTINSSHQNGGTPTFKWFKNGNLISGATSDILMSSAWANGDKIKCEMTSSYSCAQPKSVMSNEKTIKVFNTVYTSAHVIKSKKSICSDDLVTFTLSATGQGLNSKVQWYYNEMPASTNPSAMTISVNNSSDSIVMYTTSSEVCAQPKLNRVVVKIDSVKQGPIVDYFPNKYIAFCEGDSVSVKVINGQPTYGYQWSNGVISDSFYSAKTSTYYLTVSEAGNNCLRKIGPLNTQMNPKPFKPAIQILPGNILRAAYNDNYQWQLDKQNIFGADTQTYKMQVKGMYRVKIVNSTGCVNYSDDMMFFLTSTSNQLDQTISIYPNPSNGQFTISSQDKKMTSIEVYDMFGKKIYSEDLSTREKSFSLDNAAKGQYFILLKTENDSYQTKIVVE